MNTKNYEVHYLDVKDADSIIVRYEEYDKKYIVLIDAGNVADADKIKEYIWNHWKTYDIDLAICTHPDSDHKGGFFGLLNDPEITVKQFWINSPDDVINETDYKKLYPGKDRITHCYKCYNHPTDNSQNLITLAFQKCGDGNVFQAYDGQKHSCIPISVIGPTREFYYPYALEILENNKPQKYEDNSVYEDIGVFSAFQAASSIDTEEDDESPTNASSIILMFNVLGKRFIFLGDANREAICNVINNHQLLEHSIIKVPHHGSKHNLNSKLIDILKPSCAIISAKGSKKHPSRGIVHCLSKHCNVYSTHKSGDLYYTNKFVKHPAEPLKKRQ